MYIAVIQNKETGELYPEVNSMTGELKVWNTEDMAYDYMTPYHDHFKVFKLEEVVW